MYVVAKDMILHGQVNSAAPGLRLYGSQYALEDRNSVNVWSS